MIHPDEEVRVRNRARLTGDPDLKLLLDEINRLRLQVQAENTLNIALTSKLANIHFERPNA